MISEKERRIQEMLLIYCRNYGFKHKIIANRVYITTGSFAKWCIFIDGDSYRVFHENYRRNRDVGFIPGYHEHKELAKYNLKDLVSYINSHDKGMMHRDIYSIFNNIKSNKYRMKIS